MVYITPIMPLVINDLGGGHTYIQTHRQTDTHAYQHANQSNFKKTDVHQPVAGMCLV